MNQKGIGVFRFDSQKFICNASIKDIAYRKRFYDDDDSFEKILADEEGKWKGLLDVFLGKNVTTSTLTWLQDAVVRKPVGFFDQNGLFISLIC